MKTKLIRLLLCLLVATLFCPLLAACSGNKGNENSSDATTEASGTSESGEVTSDESYRDDIPDTLRFEGDTVTFVSRSYDWYKKELTLDAENAEDIIDDAVVARRNKVEHRLGLLIENTMLDGSGTAGYTVVINAMRSDKMADSHLYDIAVNNMYHTMEVVSEGLFANLKEVPHMNLSKGYYSQNYNEQATVNNVLYSTTGDASLSFIRFAFVTFFNKQVQKNYNIPDLYDAVENKEWTIDYQINLCKDLYADLDQDGVRSNGDLYGFATNNVTGVDPYTSAFGMQMVGRTDEGKLTSVVDGNVERFTNILTKIIDFYALDGVNVLAHQSDDGEWTTAETMLAEDRVLFTTLRLGAVEDFTIRNMEHDYGIIPMPLWDESQEQYYSYCHDLFSVFCVSKGIAADHLEAVGATMEVFFSESQPCRETLFEVALKVKYQRSEEASRMLDIVIDNVNIDAGWIYAGALVDFAQFVRKSVQNGTKNFNGYWRMNGNGFKTALDNLQTQFDAATAA